jgi:acyl carrier protein
MGMDSIEILMKVEDTFGIKIPDAKAEKIITVSDFHNSVWQHLSVKNNDKCKSQSLFYQFRKSVAETFSFSKQQFLLDTPPNEVFPQQNRRQLYFSFAQSNNLKLPDLVLTRTWAVLLNTVGFITILGGLATSVILINFFDFTKWMLFIPVIGITLTVLLSKLIESKRTLIKETSMKEFTERTLVLNYKTLNSEQGINRREMETVINHIIADMAGLELEEITPDKKISDDLGID